MRGDGTSSTAHGNERTVAALLFLGTEALEPVGGGLPQGLLPSVNVTCRFGFRSGEARTRVQRPIGADRVRVTTVYLAGPHVNPIRRREAPFPGFAPEERHLLVDEVARI